MGLETMEKLRKRPLLLLLAFCLVFFYITPLYNKSTIGSCEMKMCLPLPAVFTWDAGSNFLVYTNACKIMDMDPFDKSVKKFLKISRPTDCKSPLVRVVNESLEIDEKEKNNWKYDGSRCCYKEITRIDQNPNNYTKWADWGYRISDTCVPIPSPKTSGQVGVPFMKIECYNGLGISTVEDFESTVLPIEKHSEKTKSKAKAWNNNDNATKPPSILLVGIDSISRMHMIRSLPKTREFLNQNDFVEMKGYTKIGENTFPNIMGMMAGLTAKEMDTCWPNRSAKIDDCPFIWKNFSDLNYITAHLEDAPHLAIFNYEKTGFVEQPTDYYLRTLMTAQYKFAQKAKRYSRNCVSGNSFTSYMLKYIKRFLKTVGSKYPYFLLSWFTTVGHDTFNGLQNYDDSFRDVLNDAVHNPDYNGNNTIILFISDHGYRFGAFRETFLGYYEESLPFFYIRLPPTLKSLFPHWYESLQFNSVKLTSPLDLHETLQDILTTSSLMTVNDPSLEEKTQSSFSNRIVKRLQTVDNSSKGLQLYSFFEPMPTNRTCENSGIPQQYCMCGVTPLIGRKTELSSHLGEVVVKIINEILQSEIKSGMCSPLKFSRIMYGREVNKGEIWNNFNRLIGFNDYLIAVEVLPNKGHFEAKMRIFSNGTETILGTVSRINSYKGQSDCMGDYTLKNYCMCTNHAKKSVKKHIAKPKSSSVKPSIKYTKAVEKVKGGSKSNHSTADSKKRETDNNGKPFGK